MNKAKEENITTHQQKKEQTENRIFFKKTKILIFFLQTLLIDPCLGSNMNLTFTERTFHFHLLLFSL